MAENGLTFSRATKKHARFRLALCGPAGSGKTLSALRVAAGMGGRVALIDTERGSASLYADRFEFDVLEIHPPYQPSKYAAAIKAAQAAGYEVLVIDSLSHAWAGEGGILETVDAAQAKGGNKFTAWGPAGAALNQLTNAMLGYPGHVIATMRSKQEYALQTNERGKQVPVKLGMAPVQRDGVEYEFGTVLEIDMRHEATVGLVGKDRTGLFTGEPAVLTEDDGRRIREWLGQSPAVHAAPAVEPRAKVAEALCKSVIGCDDEEGVDLIIKGRPKGFLKIQDEHSRAVEDTTRRQRLIIRQARIEQLREQLGFGDVQMSLAAQQVGLADMEPQTPEEAAKLIAALEAEAGRLDEVGS